VRIVWIVAAVIGAGCGSVAPNQVDPTCSDSVTNGDETDVDCGGSCDPCGLGKTCDTGSDCASGSCPDGTCVEVSSSCGDHVTDPGEDCDDGIETATCDDDCTSVECGDSHTNGAAGEACDDGVNAGGEGGCLPDCSAIQTCGDGVLEGTETCDDDGVAPNDGCSATCQVEHFSRCTGVGAGSCHRIRILWAVADADSAPARGDIAAVTGGLVDYFAATAGTPDLTTLDANYDCVFTHPDSSYADPTAMGTVLASFVDDGGAVVLGVASGYMPPTGLLGTPIFGPTYSPVVLSTSVTYAAHTYSGNGTSALHAGVTAYGASIVDTTVVAQGTGVLDGTYTDGIPTTAYRADYRVAYVNGTNDPPFTPTGDWARLIANACAAGFAN
jgi:cysteine-rich repeat protein